MIFSGSKISKIIAQGAEIKSVYLGSGKIWSSAVAVTFVEGGASSTVEYDVGATVSRNTAPAGASFVGWSKSP